MVGYDSKQGIIKHYRVDKMIKISCTDARREGAEVFDSFDITDDEIGVTISQASDVIAKNNELEVI